MPTEGRVLQRRRDHLLALAERGSYVQIAVIYGNENEEFVMGKVKCAVGLGGRQYSVSTGRGETFAVYIREIEQVTSNRRLVDYDNRHKVALAFNVVERRKNAIVEQRAEESPRTEELEEALA